MIKFKIAEQTLNLGEAEKFAADLNTKIRSAKRRAAKDIQLVDGKYISREIVYDFFRRFVPELSVRNRAGKLFAPLVRSSMPFYARNKPPMALKVVCADCKLPLSTSETCTVNNTANGHKYYVNHRDYLIDVESLMEYKDQFLDGGSHQLSGKKINDFQTLILALK